MTNHLESLREDLDRINGNVNGLFAKVSKLEARLPEHDELEVSDVDTQAIAELQDRIGGLERQVAALRSLHDADLERKAYQDLTKQEKIQEIRLAPIREAAGMRTKKGSMDYQGVLFLFNGQPSTGHIYELMQLAGQADGFNYQEREENNRLTVDLRNVDAESKTLALGYKEPEETEA